MAKKFYVTTPIYYANGRPHIGHAYTNIAADAVARFKKLCGQDTYFLTGTDEHGQKIAQAAEEAGVTPQEFLDGLIPMFTSLWEKLNISHDDFIRTTQQRHKDVVQKILEKLYKQDDLYESEYTGWYCVPCETFWPETQLESENCPDCGHPLEKITEKNYFFRLSKYQDWLVSYIKEHEDFIKPVTRRNEILSFLENPLNDLCITRPKDRISWGIEVPFSPDHVVYVWFDALINYISAAGFSVDDDKFNSLWPCDYHLIGKDILRPHTVYWPIMLKSIGLELPKTVFAHGWWQVDGGKMSKSKGNVVDPLSLVDKYGQDAFRYFLLRDVRFGFDGTYSEEAVAKRYNSDLGNDLGNLLQRTLTMTEKYFDAKVPEDAAGSDDLLCVSIKESAQALAPAVVEAMDELNFTQALVVMWEFISKLNRFIEEKAPWTLAKTGKEAELASVIYHLLEGLRIISVAISPFMPSVAQRMFAQLALDTDISKLSLDDMSRWGDLQPGSGIGAKDPLFPRITD